MIPKISLCVRERAAGSAAAPYDMPKPFASDSQLKSTAEGKAPAAGAVKKQLKRINKILLTSEMKL